MARVEEASSDAGSGRQGLWLITLLLCSSAPACVWQAPGAAGLARLERGWRPSSSQAHSAGQECNCRGRAAAVGIRARLPCRWRKRSPLHEKVKRISPPPPPC
jgi:hypothetical protein